MMEDPALGEREGPLVNPSSSLERWARTTPEGLALAWVGGKWSFEELNDRVSNRSDELTASGVAGGTAVSLAFREGPHYFRDLLALWRSGAVVAPMPPRPTERDEEQLDGLFRPLHRVGLEGDVHSLREPEEALMFGVRAGVSALVRTSGTSGAPRGVVLRHSAFIASAEASQKRLGLSAADRWGLMLSPAHVGALGTVVRAVHLGAALRTWPSFDAASLAEAIREGDVTHVSVVPAMVSALLDEGLVGPVETLKCLLVGGAPTPDALLTRARERRLPVALTWGLTEVTAQVATAGPDLVVQFPGTVGPPLACVEADVGPEGRMRVRGSTVASGIIHDLGADPTPLPLDPDGWFVTDDLGSIDEAGRVWIEGRADDAIISGGVNVSPREVENVLSEAKGVREAAVFGVSDDRWGQVVVAAVVPNDSDPPSASALDAHCRAHLTRGKCPTHIVFVDALPRTSSGKVAKSLLPKLLNANP